MADAAQDFTERQRQIWKLGNYPAIANVLEPASHAVLDACGVSAGTNLLDVGAGTGNLSLEAARRGARVTASDLTPEMIEKGKQRAEGEGVALEWMEADAENLPFEDGTYDVTTSVFGAIFAPRAQRAASEMVRVTKPGGVVGFTAWELDGYIADTFALSASYMPTPPEGIDLPTSWGDEATARARFEAAGAEVEIQHKVVVWSFPTFDEFAAVLANAAPMVAAKNALPPEDFERMLAEHREIEERHNQATDGGVHIEAPYLLILARKPA